MMTKSVFLTSLLAFPQLLSAQAKNVDPMAEIEQPFEEDPTFFNETVKTFQTDPAFAGQKVGVRIGSMFAVVDRTNEPMAKQSSKDTALDKIIAMTNRASALKANLHIRYVRETIDDNGKPMKETLDIDAGVQTGAAAMAEASMEEAMGKQHR